MNETTATVSEYKIGHTAYMVKTTFNLAFRESLSDILKRLIIRDCEDFQTRTGKASCVILAFRRIDLFSKARYNVIIACCICRKVRLI